MLMCAGAMLLVVLLGIIFSSNHSQVLEGLRQTWLVLLIMAAILAVLGALRGMLDSLGVPENKRERKSESITFLHLMRLDHPHI